MSEGKAHLFEDGNDSPAFCAVRTVSIQAILCDVEIERRQSDVGEIRESINN